MGRVAAGMTESRALCVRFAMNLIIKRCMFGSCSEMWSLRHYIATALCHCLVSPFFYCCCFCHFQLVLKCYCSNAHCQCYCHCHVQLETTVLINDSINDRSPTHCAVSPQESGDGRYLHRCEVRIPFKKSQRGCIARHTLVASTGTLRFDMSRRALIWSPGRKVRTQHAVLDDFGFVVVVVNCGVLFSTSTI